MGVSRERLTDVYIKQVRSILEVAVPVWNPGITMTEKNNIERVQKAALHIILGQEYQGYSGALQKCNLEKLADRRVKLCKTFATKTAKNPKFNWFKKNKSETNTRIKRPVYKPVYCKTKRFENSPISYLTRLLNEV